MSELERQALLPAQLLGLSPDQVCARDRWNEELGAFDWRPNACTVGRVIDWMEIEDAYTGEGWFVPADFILIGRRDAGDPHAIAIADSNGCASGSDSDLAKLSAVLELIERDAVARWWYGRRARSTVKLSEIEDSECLISYLSGRRRTCSLIDITTDVGIASFAAVSAEQSGADVALGSGAAIDPRRAALSALTEMLQMEVALEMVREAGGASGTWGRWRREVTMRTAPFACLVPQCLCATQGPKCRHLRQHCATASLPALRQAFRSIFRI